MSETRDRGSKTGLTEVTAAAQQAGVTIYAATYSAFRTAFTVKSPDEDEKPPEYATFNQTVPGPPSADSGMDFASAITELARLQKENAAKILADATGGATLPFTRQRGLEDAIQKLGRELHSDYLLSFAPDPKHPVTTA